MIKKDDFAEILENFLTSGHLVFLRPFPAAKHVATASLRRRHFKPCCVADTLNLVYSVCELVQKIVFESRRVARTYVGVFDWLVSYAVCD